MIPSAGAVLEGSRFFARGRATVNTGRLKAALLLAQTLAGEGERDEPAAIFFAFACFQFSRATALVIARNHARALGLALHVSVDEADAAFCEVIEGEIDYETLRAWVAPRLRSADDAPGVRIVSPPER